METITTYTIFFIQSIRNSIQICIIRHSLMESGIKHTNLRNIRQNGRDCIYTFQVSRIVKRSQVIAGNKSVQHFPSQQYRLAELLTSMHHTVPHGVDLIQRFDRTIFRAYQCIQNKLYTYSMFGDIFFQNLLSAADLDGLEEREDRGLSLDGQIVDMGGILTEVKGKATKKGAYMGFITLEDLTGQIECLVFPKVYERYQGMMAVDDLVVLHGRLSIREEEAPKLLVEKLIPLEAWHPEESAPAAPMGQSTARPVPPPKRHTSEAPKLTDAQAAAKAPRKLYLRLNRPQMDAASSTLSLYPGSVPVYLHLPAEKMTLLAPKTGWCDASDGCLNRLNALLGAENVKLLESR